MNLIRFRSSHNNAIHNAEKAHMRLKHNSTFKSNVFLADFLQKNDIFTFTMVRHPFERYVCR